MQRTPNRALLTLSVALLTLPACGAGAPRYIVEYAASSPVFEGDRVWFTIVRSQAHQDSVVFLVECPRGAIVSSALCAWHPTPEQAAGPVTATAAARARASADHGCEPDRVTVQSGTTESGFWLLVCGQQRFYRAEGGSWIDRTP